jgi:two-component system chemotaxis response regulator CheY
MTLSVMIVDDSRAMRKFMRRVIDLSGFGATEYLEAADGREALDLLRDRPAGLILTDINMPVMNGEQLVERLREDPELSRIPVIVVSTDATDHRIHRMLRLGARGYVTKPFQPEQLREEMERVLEGNLG